jgi:hypothetical protein
MPCVDEKVIGGIDTHKDLHFAVVVDVTGEVLGERAFATTRQGYRVRARRGDHLARRPSVRPTEGPASRARGSGDDSERCLRSHWTRAGGYPRR